MLESRRCLTVAVAVNNGSLSVTGDADGAVAITAQADGSLLVTDNGATVQSVTGVTKDIKVKLDDAGTANDDLTITLDAQAVDRVIVDLGGGDNTFLMASGTVNKNLSYKGGDGDDSVTIAAAASVTRDVSLRLGDGDNKASVEGTIARSLTVSSRGGDDSLSIAASAVISRNVSVLLGEGDNTIDLGGKIDGSFFVRADQATTPSRSPRARPSASRPRSSWAAATTS